ncbi:TolC family protein [Pelomonas sp. BJYL3]|uniref:TolC family protein n=1 Tax=Pelomonas sp. BJYL3 TaxID=2976697 RepID=UPI0022B4A818|nr:TolC family protein [Pelomonas sp. BJYL3]
MPQFRRLPTRSLLAVLVTAAFAGCAIQPQALSPDERQAALKAGRTEMFQQQEPVQGPITLDEAMARAIKYNLDHRVKLMEEVVSQRQLNLSRTDLLPKLALSAGYSGRDNELASSSRSVISGNQSLEPSTSSDKEHRNGDLSLSWNVLDFGVSYYGAHQQADRVQVAEERRRKVLHLLMQQTRQAWWQAAGAQLLEARIDPVLKLARQALDDSRQVEVEKLRSPLEALTYQRQLLDIVRQLEAVRDELAQAKPRLASIMNLPPGEPFSVAVGGALAAPKVSLPVADMEEAAMLRRPELVEAQYNERIGLLETRKALARLLPGVELSVGQHYDSNSYLSNHRWGDVGLRVSWNLFNVLNAGTIRGVAQSQLELARQQRLALSMAVLTQVHVARLDYLGRLKQYQLTDDLNKVEQRILQYTRNAATANSQGKMEEIRASASAMMSELRLYQTYGALQGAYGQLVATLGLDPLPESVPSHDLKALGESVRASEANWTKTINPGGGA